MRPHRKISRDVAAPVVVILPRAVAHTQEHRRGTMVGMSLCLQTRRELVFQLAPQYQSANRARKREVLDAFTQITGYHRRYAMSLLRAYPKTCDRMKTKTMR